MRPALISEVRVEKKPRFTSSALTRARSRSRQSIRLSRSKTRHGTLDFLLPPAPLFQTRKRWGREPRRWKHITKRGVRQELGRNVGDERYEGGIVRASMDRLYTAVPPAAGWGSLLEGNQADNPINKLAGIHALCIPILVVLDLIDRFHRTFHDLMFCGTIHWHILMLRISWYIL